MLDKVMFAVFIYLISIMIIIATSSWYDKNKENRFYFDLYRLLQNDELDDTSLKSLISKMKIKRYSVISALNRLYLDIRLEYPNESSNKKNKLVVYDLLSRYEKEINFPDLPKTLLDKIQLLKEQSPHTEELIQQLADVINDIYLSGKKYKKVSMSIAIISLVMTAISFFQNISVTFH